jgi:hypothetical protein
MKTSTSKNLAKMVLYIMIGIVACFAIKYGSEVAINFIQSTYEPVWIHQTEQEAPRRVPPPRNNEA